MKDDLSIRLHAYCAAPPTRTPDAAHLHAEALASSNAAAAALSAAIICSHTLELRGDSTPVDLLPGQDELDILAADKTVANPDANPDAEAAHEATPHGTRLPLHPGNSSLANLALGAAGIPAIKGRHG